MFFLIHSDVMIRHAKHEIKFFSIRQVNLSVRQINLKAVLLQFSFEFEIKKAKL